MPGPPASFTPFVTAILAAKPNILETLVSFASAPGLTASMTAGGFTGTNINFVGYVPGLLASSAQLAAAFNGAYVSSQIVPQEAQTAYIKQMETDLTSSNAACRDRFITFAMVRLRTPGRRRAGLHARGRGQDAQHQDLRTYINNGNYTYKASAEGGPGQMEFPAMHFIAADCPQQCFGKINGLGASCIPDRPPFTCRPSPVAEDDPRSVELALRIGAGGPGNGPPACGLT